MKYIIITIAIVLCTPYVWAQTYTKRTPTEKAQYYTDEMVKDLQLDSSMASKVFEINLLVSLQFDSLYATKSDKDQARQGAISIYKKRDASLRQVLSTQQFLMFDDIQREKREKKRLEKQQKEKE